jgi:NAD+ synthase (glutamine-hydrolysing)
MSYVLLDAIEDSAILDRHTPVEVFQEMRVRLPDLAAPDLVIYVVRFIRVWCRNCFPILSGGYERELAELRAYALRTS